MKTDDEKKASARAAYAKWWAKLSPEERKARSHAIYENYRASMPDAEYRARRKARDAARIAKNAPLGKPLDRKARTPEQVERNRARSLEYYYRKKAERTTL